MRPSLLRRLPPAARHPLRAAGRGRQVHREAQHPEREDERDDPLEDRGRVQPALAAAHAEAHGQPHLDQHEAQLEPEAGAQHAVLPVADPQALVLGAQEDRGEHVADDEQGEEDVVQARVPQGVEDGQADEADGAGDGAHDGRGAERRLHARGGRGEHAAVPQRAVGDEGRVEAERREHAAGDEQRLQVLRAHVGDVGDGLRRAHGRVPRRAVADPAEEEAEERR